MYVFMYNVFKYNVCMYMRTCEVRFKNLPRVHFVFILVVEDGKLLTSRVLHTLIRSGSSDFALKFSSWINILLREWTNVVIFVQFTQSMVQLTVSYIPLVIFIVVTGSPATDFVLIQTELKSGY